jgi:DNA repair protein RecO (recombination protein O)
MILTTEAIVLRTMKYSESSLIAALFTRDHGKISIIAKGARRKSRPFGASIEAMNHVRAVIYFKAQRELQLLTQCDLVERYPALVEDLPRMGIGMAAVELLHLATEHDEAHPEVFQLTVDLFRSVQNATRGHKNALYAYEIQLLGLLGFKPSLRQCVSCREDIGAFGNPPARSRFRVTGRGILCERCGEANDTGIAISAAACGALERFQSCEGLESSLQVAVTPDIAAEIEETLHHLVRVHLIGMRSLKSEKVFSRIQ